MVKKFCEYCKEEHDVGYSESLKQHIFVKGGKIYYLYFDPVAKQHPLMR